MEPQGFWMVNTPVAALMPATMYMWSPTRLPVEFAGVDIRIPSPALKLEAMLDRIEASELAEPRGFRLSAARTDRR